MGSLFLFVYKKRLPIIYFCSFLRWTGNRHSLRRPGLRKAEDEFRSNSFRADHINIFTVGLDDFPDNGKAKPCPLLILSSG